MSEVLVESHEMDESNKTEKASVHVQLAGEAIKPPLSEYIGSFNLHVYKAGFALDKQTFYFATQFIGDIPESLAIEAAKELKTRMLAKYGHSPKQRK